MGKMVIDNWNSYLLAESISQNNLEQTKRCINSLCKTYFKNYSNLIKYTKEDIKLLNEEMKKATKKILENLIATKLPIFNIQSGAQK